MLNIPLDQIPIDADMWRAMVGISEDEHLPTKEANDGQ